MLVRQKLINIAEKENVFFSEMSVELYRTKRCYIPENSTLRNRCCEKLTSNLLKV
jgi:hypothetical protein